MVVHLENAPVALSTVVRAVWLCNQASLAESHTTVFLLLDRNQSGLLLLLRLFLFLKQSTLLRRIFVFIGIELALARGEEAKVKVNWLAGVHHVLDDIVIQESFVLHAKARGIAAVSAAATERNLFVDHRVRQIILTVLGHLARVRIHRQKDGQKELQAQENEDDEYDLDPEAVVLFLAIVCPIVGQPEGRIEVTDKHRVYVALKKELRSDT